MGENIHPPMTPAEEQALAKSGKNPLHFFFVIFCGVSICTIGRNAVSDKYSPEAGQVAWAVLMAVCITAGFFYGRYLNRRQAQRRRLLRERYQYVYRVLALPPELSTFAKHPSAKIEVGDFGWEAPPLANDGLIYLQGLTPDWKLVWHAGFHPNQIEKVGPKPQSQYDYVAEDEFPVCPYPINERPTKDLGLPG